MNIEKVAKVHIAALPDTVSSRLGVEFVSFLYRIVRRVGYVLVVEKGGGVAGVVSGVGRLILTLVVVPKWQRRGVGRELIALLPGRRYVYTRAESVGFYQKMGFGRWFTLGEMIVLCRK